MIRHEYTYEQWLDGQWVPAKATYATEVEVVWACASEDPVRIRRRLVVLGIRFPWVTRAVFSPFDTERF